MKSMPRERAASDFSSYLNQSCKVGRFFALARSNLLRLISIAILPMKDAVKHYLS